MRNLEIRRTRTSPRHERRAAHSAVANSALNNCDDCEARQLDRLWREYKRTGHANLRDRLIIHYMSGHVRIIAQRLRQRLPREVDVDELVNEAYTGLVEAIERFDLDRDVRFETYSSRRVVGAMRDYLRRIDPVPRLLRSRAKVIQSAIETFRKAAGRPPDIDELRSALHEMAARRARRRTAGSGCAAPISHREPESRAAAALNRPGIAITVRLNDGAMTARRQFADASDAESDAMGGLEDRQLSSPLSTAERDDLRRWVVRGLSRRDQLIVTLYYYEQLKMKEIGRALGCSESRVSQRLEIIRKGLQARLNRTDTASELE